MRGTAALFLFVTLLPLVSQEAGDEWETFYSEGVRAEELLSDDLGRPLQSRFFKDEWLQEVRSYEYEDSLVTIDVRKYGRDGTQDSWKEILRLREDGSVRMMEKIAGDRSILTGWSDRVEWTRGGDGQEIRLFGNDGEIRERVMYREDEKREEEFFSYGEDGLLVSSELIRPGDGERVITRYAPAGLPAEVLTYKRGLLAEEKKSSYDESGRLIREETRGNGLLSERLLVYGEGEDVSEERIYKNGFMTRKILYEGEERTEEIYNRGRLTLTIRYRGTEILSEEKTP